MGETMQAYVVEEAGGPEALVLKQLPVPKPRSGWVLIRTRAFGLNRAEHFTRRGLSPTVQFPRVLGIECVGEVVAAPGSDLKEGQRVAAMMGGMGRAYDGSYAEYTSVPRAQVFALDTQLGWAALGALPEMLQTVHGSLHTGLDIAHANNLLIRGGTSSVGLAALAVARTLGVAVTVTSRSRSREAMLKAAGAAHVLVDEGTLQERVRQVEPDGFDRVLELVGATTLADSLQCARPGGVVCMTGILGGSWTLEGFRPMEQIPNGVRLTAYSGNATDITPEQLQNYVSMVEQGTLSIHTGAVFRFDQLQEAHRVMDSGSAGGKLVVVVD